MANRKRFSEGELILPALYIIEFMNGVTTSDLIKELTKMLKPTGEDNTLLNNRKDTKFSQKVRNLKSHSSLTKHDYVSYKRKGRNGYFKIKTQGIKYLKNNIQVLERNGDVPIFQY